MEMPDKKNNDDKKEVSAFNTHEPGWHEIDLEPRNLHLEPYHAEATVIDQCPGWTNYHLEAQTPPKKRWWRYDVSKIFVGIAIVAMVVTGIAVPMAVTIYKRESKGIQ